MRTKHNKMVRLLAPFLAGASVTIVAAGAVGFAEVVRSGAKVGDIIAFEPSRAVGPDQDARIAVHRANQFGCVLDLNTIRRSGGSLVVEASLSSEGKTFRLHWAGERTTADSGDCGRSADLIVDRRDLDSLALAAGGYGVGPKRAPVFTTALPMN